MCFSWLRHEPPPAPRSPCGRGFSPAGLRFASSDPRNAAWITTYTYNDTNQREVTTAPAVDVWNADTGVSHNIRPVTTSYYDSLGRVIATRDANSAYSNSGVLTRDDYDAAGNKIKEIGADGSTRTWGYDTLGREVQERDGQGNATNKTYDHLDRLLFSDPTGYASGQDPTQTYTYDELGNRTSVTDALGQAACGRLVTRAVLDAAIRQAEVQEGVFCVCPASS